jgi:alpha/beta superfamily hydrolase
MHNKVVYRLARGLRKAGAVTLRFNYRGVNLSEGGYDHAVGEVEDAHAALNFLIERCPGLPFTLAGFSFGARIVVQLGYRHPGARRIIAAGFPTRGGGGGGFHETPTPRIFIQSTNDEHGPKEELERLVKTLPGENTLHWIEARNHFFDTALDDLEQLVTKL